MGKLKIYCLKSFGLVCLILALVGCEEKDINYYLKLQGNYVQGSVEEQKYLDKALEIDSLHVSTLIEKSVSYNKRGQYATGMYYLNKGVELDPVEHLGYRGFVKLYMLRDYEDALDDFLRLDPLTPEFRDSPWGECIYKVIGLCYMGQGDYSKALDNFNQSIVEITKESGEDWVEPRTFLYKGVSLMKTGAPEQAVHAFNKHISYCPECPSGYYYKAKAILESKENNIEEVNNLLNKADSLVKEELIVSSPYFELPYQIYPSDISELKQTLVE